MCQHQLSSSRTFSSKRTIVLSDFRLSSQSKSDFRASYLTITILHLFRPAYLEHILKPDCALGPQVGFFADKCERVSTSSELRSEHEFVCVTEGTVAIWQILSIVAQACVSAKPAFRRGLVWSNRSVAASKQCSNFIAWNTGTSAFCSSVFCFLNVSCVHPLKSFNTLNYSIKLRVRILDFDGFWVILHIASKIWNANAKGKWYCILQHRLVLADEVGKMIVLTHSFFTINDSASHCQEALGLCQKGVANEEHHRVP